MEDIRALCQRSVVINHGSKIYDGSTEELFKAYQKNKQITVVFGGSTGEITLPEYVRRVEQTAHKLTVLVPREQAGAVLKILMEYEPMDITVEEDEIGTVVERIYREKGMNEITEEGWNAAGHGKEEMDDAGSKRA